MKFTDGFWLMREGVHASYATEVRDLRPEADRFTAYASVKRVETRGDTLNSALLTVECHAPAEGVIGVRVTHHAGRVHRGPDFELDDSGTGTGTVHVAGPVVELASGPLRLRLDRSAPWTLEFRDADGRPLTEAGRKGTAFVTTADGAHHTAVQLAIGVGEQIYGLGERFTPS